MAYSGYSWTPSHSLTAIKYQRHGFVEKKPFLPGERYKSSVKKLVYNNFFRS
jgi:hypothetical protein